MSWVISYRASSGQPLVTRHDTREQAFNALADQLFGIALDLWALGGRANEDAGDCLMRHAVRLTAEAEMGDDSCDGYLLNLSKGRKWVVCAI